MFVTMPDDPGPSTRRRPTTIREACLMGEQCPWYQNEVEAFRFKRQAPSSSSSSSSTSSSSSLSSSSSTSATPTSSGSTSTSKPLFDIPSHTSTSFSFPASSSTSTATPSWSNTYTSQASFPPAPWRPSHAPSAIPSNVPGIVLNMSLSGDTDTEAVYSVPMQFGHVSSGSRRAFNGGTPQTLNVQVDLGSSDMWVAGDTCTSSDCSSSPGLFDASQSLDSNDSMELSYQSGSVDGDVYWDQTTLGGFAITYQAFVLADDVSNEDLGGGNFSGVLGLALPENSVIFSKIGGSTSGNPDGATFLDNLFGLGIYAPSRRLFAFSFERREDVRTQSSFAIGTLSPYCPVPCNPPFTPIVAVPKLGTTGFTHWRMQVDAVSITKWQDAQHGSGATSTNVTLGASVSDPDKTSPLMVLDSGGVQILVATQAYADSIYSQWGISASSDGLYRMPCTTQLAMSFYFSGQEYPVHPLDMSYPDPQDPSQQTCIGMIQVSDDISYQGDFILGSAFLKNVYSIFQYPNNNDPTNWQPTVGLVSLTNSSIASQDFYAVRSLHETLSSVSANNPSSASGTSGTSSPSPSPIKSVTSAHSVLSKAGIAGISVVAFLILSAGAFCAWWFWLRRKYARNGTGGKVLPEPPPSLSDDSSRNLKHSSAKRQKSIMEGYSDTEGDSWIGTPEGADSIRLGYVPNPVKVEEFQGMPSEYGDFGEQPRSRSPSATRALSMPQYTSSRSLNMSGPFPTNQRASTLRPDSSPLYDIRTGDYFDRGSPTRGRTGRRSSLEKIDQAVVESPSDINNDLS